MTQWRPCTRPKRTPNCADTMGPWGRMRLGPVRQILDWCYTLGMWRYEKGTGRCLYPLASFTEPCTPDGR